MIKAFVFSVLFHFFILFLIYFSNFEVNEKDLKVSDYNVNFEIIETISYENVISLKPDDSIELEVDIDVDMESLEILEPINEALVDELSSEIEFENTIDVIEKITEALPINSNSIEYKENEVVESKVIRSELDSILKIQKHLNSKKRDIKEKMDNSRSVNKIVSFNKNILIDAKNKRKDYLEKKKIEEVKENNRRLFEEEKNRLAVIEKEKNNKIKRDAEIRRVNNEKVRYASQIRSIILSNWKKDFGLKGWECKIAVIQDRNGNVIDMNYLNSCENNDSFKDSIKRAVYISSPLPKTNEDEIFSERLIFTFEVQ